MDDLEYSTATIQHKGMSFLPDSSGGNLEKLEIPNPRIPSRSIEIFTKGRIVQAIRIPSLQILIKRSDRKSALKALTGKPLDLSTYGTIPCRPKIRKPRSCRYLKLKLTGSLTGVPDLLTTRSEIKILNLSKESIILEIKKIEEPKINFRLPVKDNSMEQFLGSTDFINWQEGNIIAVSKELSGNEQNTMETAKIYCNWVYKNINQRALDTGMLPASEVLQIKAGDCTELSVLLCALCRAKGIPSRTIYGLVYSEGYFDFHMWAEVYAGSWIPMDPVFNQTSVDAAHIPLGISNLEKFDLWKLEDALMLTMGQLRIEKLLQR